MEKQAINADLGKLWGTFFPKIKNDLPALPLKDPGKRFSLLFPSVFVTGKFCFYTKPLYIKKHTVSCMLWGGCAPDPVPVRFIEL